MPDAVARALVEALPYVQRLAGRVVVVKYGGAAMKAADLSDAVMQDVVLLHAVGVRVVLCHGGGPEVSAMGRRLGIEPRFIDGLRITDDETMRVAQQVQIGGISRDVVGGIGRHGGRAIGLSGHDCGGFLTARPRQHTDRETGVPVDLGRVGDVTSVDGDVLTGLLDTGLIPVIAPVAVDGDQRSMNVNADSVATAVAEALGATRLVFLTDVAGIRGEDGAEAARVRAPELQTWIDTGVVAGGMIPKAEACLSALRGGVEAVTVADGRVPHALLIELLTDAGVGTQVLPATEPPC
ncbi:MAG: acetylglutamate kinase [Myxococcota bacterium]|nr:acetylglutamate kinase [Myxococcota bacterium]